MNFGFGNADGKLKRKITNIRPSQNRKNPSMIVRHFMRVRPPARNL